MIILCKYSVFFLANDDVWLQARSINRYTYISIYFNIFIYVYYGIYMADVYDGRGLRSSTGGWTMFMRRPWDSHPLTAMTHRHVAWWQIWPRFRVAGWLHFTNFTLATEHIAMGNIYIIFFVRTSALRIFLGFIFLG